MILVWSLSTEVAGLQWLHFRNQHRRYEEEGPKPTSRGGAAAYGHHPTGNAHCDVVDVVTGRAVPLNGRAAQHRDDHLLMTEQQPFPDAADLPEARAVNIRNRSYTIGALVDIPAPGAQGVLFAHGSRFGGHAPCVKGNRQHFLRRMKEDLVDFDGLTSWCGLPGHPLAREGRAVNASERLKSLIMAFICSL